MKRVIGVVLLASSWAGLLGATETENLGLAVLPAPGKVAIDGKFDDWDLSGGVFTCGNVESMREKFALWTHAMYDAQHFYLLARWTDETPLNNPGQIAGSYGFQGDCLQFRFIAEPGTPHERCSHWTCWQGKDGRDVMDIAYGQNFNQGNVKDAKTQGAAQAFLKNADDKGYVQEISIPWKLIFREGRAPKPGDAITFTLEPNFTIGQSGRLTLKDIFKPGVVPDRVFTFMGSGCWGTATLESKGKMAPRPLRLADAREFKVSLVDGLPVVDWSGLIKAAELRGFKPIRFTMPEDGYLSLQILNSEGYVVRQLLNQAFMTKGPHEVQWDGLTTPVYLTPGQAVPPGNYTWRALWHKGIGVRLRGWACNGGNAPWDCDARSNWGGDHGVPCAAAAAGDKVFLGWSGAEAGAALLGCNLQGEVQWKNSRQGMAGAEFVAADGDLIYAVNWGGENSNYIYRLRAGNGTYAEYEDASPDIPLNRIFADTADRPNRVEGLSARDGKLYLSISSCRFTRKQVTNWRSLLEKAKAGKHENVKLWDKLDDGARNRAAAWLAGNQSEDEALKSPNYYTPDVRDAVVERLNRMLPDKDLVGHAASLTPDALALANRRHLEKVFSEITKLKTGMIAVVDAKTRKLLSSWEVPFPRLSYAVSDKLVYVVSDGKAVVALDGTNGKVQTLVKDLSGATGITVDKEGLIYVGVREPNNQVRIYSPEGKFLRAIGRAGGRRVTGPWQQDGMAFIAGIAVDGQGKLWVTEADMSPKRVSVWDVKTGKFVKEFFGPTSYGALGGAINPLDPNLMVGHGCEWRIDPDTSRDTCLGCFTRHGMSNSRFAIGSNGRLYLAVAPGWAFEASPVLIYERVGDVDYRLRASFTYQGKDSTRKTAVWADENGDGQQQPHETTKVDGHVRFSGWYMNFAPDLSIYARWEKPAPPTECIQLKVAGFTGCGAPKYMKVQWPEKAVPGAVLDSYPPGLCGEDFGGSYCLAKDGKLYVQAGKTGFWNCQLVGLETVKTLGGTPIAFSQAEVAAAEKIRVEQLQAAVGTKRMVVKKKTVEFSGNIDRDFPGLESIHFKKQDDAQARAVAAWDDRNLYLAWDVRDKTPWINKAAAPEQMYTGGDTVDFQLATDPKADKNRDEAGKGDLRLSIGNFRGTPTAVIYRRVCDVKKPKQFSSGVVKSYAMDYVDVVAGANIKVQVRPNDGYLVEAAIPLAVLGFKPSDGLVLPADFGVTHGAPDGGRTRLRTYWNNQQTGIVDDVVFELKMEPRNWGAIELKN